MSGVFFYELYQHPSHQGDMSKLLGSGSIATDTSDSALDLLRADDRIPADNQYVIITGDGVGLEDWL